MIQVKKYSYNPKSRSIPKPDNFLSNFWMVKVMWLGGQHWNTPGKVWCIDYFCNFVLAFKQLLECGCYEIIPQLNGVIHLMTSQFMSPVSPVFHTIITVRIGLKTQLEQEHPLNIRCLCWSEERSTFLFSLSHKES